MCRAKWHQAALGRGRALGRWAALSLAQGLLQLLRPVLLLGLRSSVRSRAFWERGLGSSWCALWIMVSMCMRDGGHLLSALI